MTRRYGIAPTTALEQAQRLHEPLQSQAGARPLPPPTGPAPYRLSTAQLEVPPPTGAARLLHVIGDSGGVQDPTPQTAVASALVADLAANPAVALLYSVGDVVYFNGDESDYYPQFYEPYARYNRPIVAIPGNHDGDNSDDTNVRSLAGFVANFCAADAHLDPQAQETNRDTMTQPNVHWTLLDDLFTLIGLYTNVPEGGVILPEQQTWLVSELKAAAADRALIVALHHPPYSCDAFHGGSARMGAALDGAFADAGRVPDLVLSGHVHSYQRFTRIVVAAKQLPYVVTGTGGYHNLHQMASGARRGLQVAPHTVLEAWDDSQWGFLRLSITRHDIQGAYMGVARGGRTGIVIDTFTASVG